MKILRTTYPDVGENRSDRALAVLTKILGDESHDRHCYAEEAVLKDSKPQNLDASAVRKYELMHDERLTRLSRCAEFSKCLSLLHNDPGGN
jgi:hypothetical protein